MSLCIITNILLTTSIETYRKMKFDESSHGPGSVQHLALEVRDHGLDRWSSSCWIYTDIYIYTYICV